MNFEEPIQLKSARAWRTYLGGKLIDELHGVKNAKDTNFPEEWLISTVTARNTGRENLEEGLSYTTLGPSLKSLIEEFPQQLLGSAHLQRFGKSTGVLVKLLDSAERLTVQVHPTRQMAKTLFQSNYGKTECWHILACRNNLPEKPCIYLGFKPGVTRQAWYNCFVQQNIPEMLSMLHRFEVQPGETYLIKGGVPHAIGAGCFLTEIQEPTDYTIRTEKTTPSGLAVSDDMCHQGLGFEKMFDCFCYNGLTAEQTLESYRIKPVEMRPGEKEVIGYQNTNMFRLKVIEVAKEYVAGKTGVFSGIYFLKGKGTLNGKPVFQGDQFFVPALCSDFYLKNSGDQPIRVLQFFGPNTKE